MAEKSALVLLTFAAPLILLSMLADHPLVPWLVAILISTLPVLLIRIAARGQDLGWGLGVLWLLLVGSWLGLLWLSIARDLSRPSTGEAAAVLGLMLLGLGVVPLLFVAWLYWRSFSARGLTPEDLERLREGGRE